LSLNLNYEELSEKLTRAFRPKMFCVAFLVAAAHAADLCNKLQTSVDVPLYDRRTNTVRSATVVKAGDFPVQTQRPVAAAPADLGDNFSALRIELWTNEACGSGFKFVVAPDDCGVTLMQNGAEFKTAGAPLTACAAQPELTGAPSWPASARQSLAALARFQPRRVPLRNRSTARRWVISTRRRASR
jgi:hypothetical protein